MGNRSFARHFQNSEKTKEFNFCWVETVEYEDFWEHLFQCYTMAHFIDEFAFKLRGSTV